MIDNYLTDLNDQIDMLEYLDDHGHRPYDLFEGGTTFHYDCPLPGHEDHGGSFVLDWYNGVFSCPQCGRQGTAIELIEALHAVPQEEAVRMAIAYLQSRDGEPGQEAREQPTASESQVDSGMPGDLPIAPRPARIWPTMTPVVAVAGDEDAQYRSTPHEQGGGTSCEARAIAGVRDEPTGSHLCAHVPPAPRSYVERLMQLTSIADVLALHGIHPEGGADTGAEFSYRCPLADHDDNEHPLYYDVNRGLFTCLTCGVSGNVIDLVMRLHGLEKAEALAWLANRVGLPDIPAAQVEHFIGQDQVPLEVAVGVPEDLSLGTLSRARCLGQQFLQAHAVGEARSMKPPQMRFGYLDERRYEVFTRFLKHLGQEPADDVFQPKKGGKPAPYGLWKLDAAQRDGHIFLVDSETEALTLWAHDLPALGMPGRWEERWSAYLEGLDTIYLVALPGLRGEELASTLATGSVGDRLRIIHLSPQIPSLNALHRQEPYRFAEALAELRSEACSPEEESRATKKRLAEAAWPKCAVLASKPDILEEFARSVEALGLAGESDIAQLVYLAVVSRLLDRPVSVAIKGASSSGKSFLVEKVLEHFPQTAWFGRTAMSDKALAYTQESLVHRFLVMFELVGMQSDMASYLIRSLLSENMIDYETVVDTPKGMTSLHIHKDGPTGLLVTTTAAALHSENETRLLSITIADSTEQTGLIMRAAAKKAQDPSAVDRQVDLVPWTALQTWLEGAEHRVVIPYALSLSERIPRLAVRLRRDVTLLFNLIRAHAILHQCNRKRDESGCIVATLEDYTVIRRLAGDLFAEGLEASIPPHIRETIQAARLLGAVPGDKTVSVEEIADKLQLDRSSVRRRLNVAFNRGLMKNLAVKGKPIEAQVTTLGLRQADAIEVLPEPSTLAAPYEVATMNPAGGPCAQTTGDTGVPTIPDDRPCSVRVRLFPAFSNPSLEDDWAKEVDAAQFVDV